MEQKKLNLPKGIKEASLIDLSTLGFKEDALDRVAIKVNAIILEEYALTKRNPNDIVAFGSFHGMNGYMAFNKDFIKEKGHQAMGSSIDSLFKENNIKMT